MPMDNDKTILSFGRYLQAIRLEKGISLEAVSKDTRIRKDLLLLIEKENHDGLPNEVFVRGFIRAYAKSIGADGDEAIRRYHSRLKVIRKITKSENDLQKSRKKFWPRLLLSIGTLLCLIVLSVIAVSIFRKPSPTGGQVQSQRLEQQIRENKTDMAPDSLTIPVIPEERKKEKQIAEKLLLKVITVEKTWMKIIIDDQDQREYSLNPGDQLELEARISYNLLIGNAGGIKLSLNDKPLEVKGITGQVVNILIP